MRRVSRLVAVAVIGWMAAVCLANDGRAMDWGTWRVEIEEVFPGAVAGLDYENMPAGIGLCRQTPALGSGISDYMHGWMQKDESGFGVAGLLPGQISMRQRVEITRFGRSGARIELELVLHDSGGVLPEAVKRVVRRKMKLPDDSNAPIGFEEAEAVKLGGKRVFFSGPFPADLPAGEYQVVVQRKDAAGNTLHRYEKRLVRRAPEPDPLKDLSDEQLLEEYVRRGEALRGTGVEPIDHRVGRAAAAYPYYSPQRLSWDATHKEIVRRGARIVPRLMTMLESEAVRNPGEATHMTAKFGFAVDIMKMLTTIDDPRPVELLVRILEGMDGQANSLVRAEALETIERMTRLTFVVERDNRALPFAMCSENPLVRSRENPSAGRSDESLKEIAGWYSQWLAGEGRDPAQWKALARKRARAALDGNDALAIRWAVTFLQGNDDDPKATMKAIAAILEREDKSVVDENRFYPSLLSALAEYGPAVREYVHLLIDQVRDKSGFSTFANLSKVGGEQAMTFMVEALPDLRAKLEQAGVSPETDPSELRDYQVKQVLSAYRACRWGIERWAGRTFDSDEAIAQWWAKAKHRSQRQWLEENLERTAEVADAGNPRAQYIFRAMTPDLPHKQADRAYHPLALRAVSLSFDENAPGAFRVHWLKENRDKLVFDEEKLVFVLRP